jgi:hypothetical protein
LGPMPNPLLVAVIVGAGIGAAIAGVINLFSEKKKIFVSYYFDADSRYKNMLMAWSENKKFNIEFEDVSADVGIKSETDADLQRVLSRKINDADVLLVIVGERTHRRKWVLWEVEKAVELGKRIVVVKLKSTYESPKELLGVGAKWAKSFDFEAIKAAIDE